MREELLKGLTEEQIKKVEACKNSEETLIFFTNVTNAVINGKLPITMLKGLAMRVSFFLYGFMRFLGYAHKSVHRVIVSIS